MREIQSPFPERRVYTLSVMKDPRARMRRFVQIKNRQKGLKEMSLKGTVSHLDVVALSAIIKDGILLRMLKSGRRIRTV